MIARFIPLTCALALAGLGCSIGVVSKEEEPAAVAALNVVISNLFLRAASYEFDFHTSTAGYETCGEVQSDDACPLVDSGEGWSGGIRLDANLYCCDVTDARYPDMVYLAAVIEEPVVVTDPDVQFSHFDDYELSFTTYAAFSDAGSDLPRTDFHLDLSIAGTLDVSGEATGRGTFDYTLAVDVSDSEVSACTATGIDRFSGFDAFTCDGLPTSGYVWPLFP